MTEVENKELSAWHLACFGASDDLQKLKESVPDTPLDDQVMK